MLCSEALGWILGHQSTGIRIGRNTTASGQLVVCGLWLVVSGCIITCPAAYDEDLPSFTVHWVNSISAGIMDVDTSGDALDCIAMTTSAFLKWPCGAQNLEHISQRHRRMTWGPGIQNDKCVSNSIHNELSHFPFKIPSRVN